MSIVVEGVRKRFGATAVLHDISARFEDGEFLCLVGPSGCGKTTLLRILAGLETADAGRVEIGGRDVTGLRPADRDVAMVFQNYALYPHLTVGQNMAVPLAMRRLSVLGRMPGLRWLVPGQAGVRRGIAADVADAAGMLGIGHLLDRRPGQLSGGQRQRVALGRAVVRRPSAFLMDEPLSNLDAELRARTRTEIVALHRRVGVTTVYVTHDQVEAMTMSDRVALMLGGRILQIGAPRVLYDDPATLEVAVFLGSPRINVWAGVVGERGVVVGGVTLPLWPACAVGSEVSVGVRAEGLRLGDAGLAGVVEHVEFLGSEVLLHARCLGEVVVARVGVGEAEGVRTGDGVRLVVDWGGALVFGGNGVRLGLSAGMGRGGVLQGCGRGGGMSAVAGGLGRRLPTPGPSVKGRGEESGWGAERWAGVLLAGPAVVGLSVLLLLPTACLLAVSLTDMELGGPALRWVGLGNYAELAGDPAFLQALRNTVVYVAVVLPLSVGLGLGIALLIEGGARGRALFRAVFFLPVVSLLVAMATAWEYLLHPTIGPVNRVLGMLGVAPVNWLGSSDWVLTSLCMIGVWENLGYVVVLFLAGLTAIPSELLAAAQTDGARRGWDRFWLVTWPMLGPTTLFVVTITAIRCLRVFDTVAALTQGGPNKASEVLLHVMYLEGFTYFRIGYSAAITVVFLVVVLVLVLLQTRVLERRVHYG